MSPNSPTPLSLYNPYSHNLCVFYVCVSEYGAEDMFVVHGGITGDDQCIASEIECLKSQIQSRGSGTSLRQQSWAFSKP